MESTAILPKLAFSLLDDAKTSYSSNNCFPDETLEQLHSLFGNTFFEACQFLESYNFKLVKYQTEDGSRAIYKVSNHREQFTIYRDINFCFCKAFQTAVLNLQESLTCKHVLAVKVGRIMKKYITEVISGQQFLNFLNEQLNYLDNQT